MRKDRQMRRGKVRALMAGGLVLGVGSMATLAAWTDTEWAWGGGENDDDNLGTSTFEMEQNTTFPDPVWVEDEDAPGQQIHFAVDATDLTPGDTVYGPIQLRVVAGSDGGSVTLDGAQLFSGDQDLFDALRYEVKTGVDYTNCNAAGFGAGGTTLVPADTVLDTGSGAVSFTLNAAPAENTPGDAVSLCFAVTLPDIPANQALQGLEAQPAWAFQAIST